MSSNDDEGYGSDDVDSDSDDIESDSDETSDLSAVETDDEDGRRNEWDGDEEAAEAFGWPLQITRCCRKEIRQIKTNNATYTSFELGNHYLDDVNQFSDAAWQLLGRYIENSAYLESVTLSNINLTDDRMALLFETLTRSGRLQTLDVSQNTFGLSGIRSMIPFTNNFELIELDIGQNENINSECFRLLLEQLNSGPIKYLFLGDCAIDDILALGIITLPRLQRIDLKNNTIQSIPSLGHCTNLREIDLSKNCFGKEGWRSIAKLLKKETPPLQRLWLHDNGVGDKEAQILANSLKHNTTLTSLGLSNNDLKEEGLLAFMKLLCNVSSIESTCASNHTLGYLNISNDRSTAEINFIVNSLDMQSAYRGHVNTIRKAKVLLYQLNSVNRKKACHQQSVEYCYSSIYADIEPIFLPHLIALTASEHGQDQLYNMLVATLPSLTPLIDRHSFVRDTITNNTKQINALSAEFSRQATEFFSKTSRLATENFNLRRRLEPADFDKKRQHSGQGRAKKRPRSSSF